MSSTVPPPFGLSGNNSLGGGLNLPSPILYSSSLQLWSWWHLQWAYWPLQSLGLDPTIFIFIISQVRERLRQAVDKNNALEAELEETREKVKSFLTIHCAFIHFRGSHFFIPWSLFILYSYSSKNLNKKMRRLDFEILEE